MSQDPRVGSGGEQEWVSLRRRFSRSTNQVTLLFTLHPSLLPTFCRGKGTFPGNESEGKKLHSNAIHSDNDFSSSKRLPTSLHNLRTQIPQFSGDKLTNAPAHLTRHNLLENSTERGNPSQNCPQRKRKQHLLFPHLFSLPPICTNKSQVFCLQSSHSH